MSYPKQFVSKIKKTEKISGTINVPPSKSLSIRAMLAASLSGGTCRLTNFADNFNSNAMKESCIKLGAQIEQISLSECIVHGVTRKTMNDSLTLNPMNSGIVLRLLMGVTSCLNEVNFITDYDNSLAKRSNSDMIEALQEMNVKVTSTGTDGRLPISICGTGISGNLVNISGKKSSQFLSGLLFLGSIIDDELNIHVIDELKSKPMVEATLSVLKQGGVEIYVSDDFLDYSIPKNKILQPATFNVESDPASSAALMAVSSIIQSKVTLQNFKDEEMGNGILLDHLKKMGVNIEYDGINVSINGTGDLYAADFDGSQTPDAVLPLAALSCFANGTSRFHNIEHIRYKESDRISDFRKELLKAGADVEETKSELIVHGKPEGIPGGATIDSHYDHAIVMALTAIGLRADKGMEINNAQYVGQTYPDFFKTIGSLGCDISLE